MGLEDGSIIVYGGFDGDKWLKDLHVLDLSEYEIDRLEQFVRGSLIYNQASAAANIHRKLFNSKVFSDFEFQFDDGQSIPAHRVVLYSQSQYFENYFFSEMQESESRRMVIHNTSSATFLRLLEFLYSGSLDCRSLPSKTLVDLLRKTPLTQNWLKSTLWWGCRKSAKWSSFGSWRHRAALSPTC